MTANPQAELAFAADLLLAVDTGPEVITGSTRLKAGTAQKLVLNAFSTAVMIRLGRTWSNLMVDVVATNAKLRGRVHPDPAARPAAPTRPPARAALEQADGELKPALLSLLAGVSARRRPRGDREFPRLRLPRPSRPSRTSTPMPPPSTGDTR